jgi:hypothetical protein
MPLLRSGRGEPPIKWWEWLFLPFIIAWFIAAYALFPLLVVCAVLLSPFALLYPERRFHHYDMGTERQVELMRRYRRFAARVTFWRRAGRALAFPFRRHPRRSFRSRA